MKKIKPQLAIAYYINSNGANDAEIFVSLDNFSEEDFIKYFKENYNWKIPSEDIIGIYPVIDAWSRKNKFDVIIKKK